MRISYRVMALAAVLMMATAQVAPAQKRATLDQAEALLRNGQLEQARTVVAQWQRENPAGGKTDANATARALMLSAQLSVRAPDAEDAYLGVALTHPTSPYADEAWLRLGQARLAAGDPRQALTYLQRLMSDYPRSEHRALGAVWLARVQQTIGKRDAGCETARDALQLPVVDSAAASLLRTEVAGACGKAPPATVIATPPPAPAAAGGFAIQIAAFREKGNALGVARQLEKAGFENVRVVLMPENALIRVRVGAFETSTMAAATLGRLKSAGYSGVVVGDAAREQNVRD